MDRGIRVNKRLIGEGEIRVHRIHSRCRGYRGRRETSMLMYSVGVKNDLKLKQKLGGHVCME